MGLSTKNLDLRGEKRKLAPRMIGPLKVLRKIGKQAYELALPVKYSRIHNVFHVSLLEPWHVRPGEETQKIFPDLKENYEGMEIQEIIKSIRLKHVGMTYLVKFQNSQYTDAWISEEQIRHYPNGLKIQQQYEEEQGFHQRPQKVLGRRSLKTT